MTNNPFLGFGITFIAAFLFRYASARSFRTHWEPKLKPERESLLKVLKLPKDGYLRNLVYLSSGMLFATSIASPFFAVYMLRELSFSYLDFAVAMAASTLATLITQPYWGKVIDKRGTRPVLFATSVLIPFIPLIWIPANGLLYVVAAHIFSGTIWAGFDLAMFNMLLKIAPRKELHDYSAHINGLGSIMAFLGGIIGSFLALAVEGEYVGLIGGLQIIFLVSAVGRFLVTALTITRITPHMSIKGSKFLMRVITVYPIKGVMAEVAEFQHMLSSIRNHIR